MISRFQKGVEEEQENITFKELKSVHLWIFCLKKLDGRDNLSSVWNSQLVPPIRDNEMLSLCQPVIAFPLYKSSVSPFICLMCLLQWWVA